MKKVSSVKLADQRLLEQKEAEDYQSDQFEDYKPEELATKLQASRVLIVGALRDKKIPEALQAWVKRLLDKNDPEDILGLADLIKKGAF